MSQKQQLPAPRTIAPSRDDVLSNLAFFFGDPVVPEKLRDYSEHHAMTFHFPDAYYGQNTKIRETLNNLILKAPQEWHTQVALPFVKIVGTTVEWDEIRFDVRLLQRVPYEGVSRMSTSLRRRHRDRVVRRGIGLTIESDFYATEAGRAHFADQLTSIRYCVQETCNFDTIFAYLSCGNYDFRYDLQKGLRPRRSVRTAMAHEINMFAIVQKESLGLDKAVEETKYRMSRYNVTPNMLVIPPQLSLYMALAPEDKLMYPLGGPSAQSAFESGVNGFESRAFRGLGVFTSTPYEVSDDQDSIQMLQRSSQVGEFYRMAPPAVFDATKVLPPHYMDLMIYDEESDRHVHISFEKAMQATGFGTAVWHDIFDVSSGGDETNAAAFVAKLKSGAGDAYGNAADTPAADYAAAYVAWKNAGEGATPVQRKAAMDTALLLHTALVGLVKAGNYVPIEIVIARPFIEHLTLSAIVAVAGRDTGATLFGPADMQISANTSVKTIEGHYTCHTKSVITKPQNVCVMRDIMCSGYVAGCNTLFFGENPKTGKWMDMNGDDAAEFDAEGVREAIRQRLSFENEDSGNQYGSMLAFGAPLGDGAKRDQVISITDRLLPWEVAHKAEKEYFPGSKQNFDAYKPVLGLGQIHYGEDTRASENLEFISQGSSNNGLCFVGPHRKFSPYSAMHQELVPGQGHFGPDAIPGDARWRRGESVSLKAARDSMVSVEAAARSQLFLGHGV